MNIKLFLILIGIMILGACTKSETVRGSGNNVPVDAPGADTSSRSSNSPEVQQRARSGQRSAVRALMRSSRRQVNAGNLSKGASILERALKISPRNAIIYSNLAEIHFKQNQLGDAESLALKSNSFARNDHDLLLRNWKIIAESRSLRGDTAGANKAASKVDKYQGR